MKRVSPWIVGIIGLAVVSAGSLVIYKIFRPPISLAEMEKLQENPAQAAREIPRLVDCFEFNNAEVRLQASLTLKNVGAPAVEPVRAKLTSSNAKVRFCAVETLGWIGPDAVAAADEIVPLLGDSDADVRYKSAYALGRFGVVNDKIVEGLVNALGDPSKDVSDTALDALGKLGPAAAPKAYQLAGAKKEIPRERMMRALTKLGKPPADAAPVLAELVKDPRTRSEALPLLSQIGAPAVPVFKELLQGDDMRRRSVFLAGIAQLGADAKPLLPDLQIILVEGADDAVPGALGIFKKCGPEGARGLADALQAVQSGKLPPWVSTERSKAILKALGEIGPEGKAGVPTLIELLKTAPALQPQILQTLGDIGPAARAAIPAVEALTTEPQLAAQAQVTLRRMGVLSEK